MNRKDIEAMEAGREMDALIAEKVMGLKLSQVSKIQDTTVFRGMRSKTVKRTVIYDYAGNDYLASYSTDISKAWSVVEKMTPVMKDLGIRVCSTNEYEVSWMQGGDDDWWLFAMSPTAPLAICRAALLAVMELDDAP